MKKLLLLLSVILITLTSCVNFKLPDPVYASPTIELKTPANISLNLETSLNLTWDSKPGVQTNSKTRKSAELAGFKIYFAPNPEEYPVVPVTVNGNVKQYRVENLEYETTYKWKVVAVQSDGKTATSTEWAFKTCEKRYDIPEIALVSPVYSGSREATTVNLTWAATPGVLENTGSRNPRIEYRVYFAKNGQQYDAPQDVGDVTTIRKSNLDYDTTYKWKVIMIQNYSQMATSTEATFTTVGRTYNAPQISVKTPVNNAENQDRNITLTWEATAGNQTNSAPRQASLYYRLYFATDSVDYPNPVNVSGKEYRVSDLDYETVYKWKVEAVQSDGATSVTDDATFMTLQRQFGKPTIQFTSPKYEISGDGEIIRFTWQADIGNTENVSQRSVPFITGYDFYFATSTFYGYPAPETTEATQSREYYAKPGVIYKYRVEVTQSDGATSTSSERLIRTNIFRYDKNGNFQSAYEKLSEAASEAHNEDRILVLDDSVLDNERAQINIDGKEFIVSSKNGGSFTLDMNRNYQAFNITNGASITLQNMIIKNAWSGLGEGGGVYLEASRLTTVNSTITGCRNSNVGNKGAYGGAIYVFNGIYDAIDTFIISNYSDETGGGISLYNSVLNMSNSHVEDNSAVAFYVSQTRGGGGISSINSDICLENSSISGNDTNCSGGGIYTQGSTLNATDVSIGSNRAVNGGGIFIYDFDTPGSVNLNGSIVFENRSDNNGSGIFISNHYNSDNTELNCEQTIIASNTAVNNGGGIYTADNKKPSITLTQSTVTANEASDVYGGGLYFGGGVLFTDNSEIANNRANNGGGGIYVKNGIFNASQTTLDSNRVFNPIQTHNSYGGGAILNENGIVTLEDSTVTSNSSSIYGGGIMIIDEGSANILNTVVVSNISDKDGGGVFAIKNGILNIRNSEIIYNRTVDSYFGGGGIGIWFESILNVVDTLIASNTTNKNGGGIYADGNNEDMFINMNKVIITKNSADESGGGMFIKNRILLNASETSVESNKSGTGGGVYVGQSIFNSFKNTIKSNESTFSGGGVFVDSGIFNASETSVESNCANKNDENFGGGGICAASALINIDHSTISKNSAESGGGILLWRSAARIYSNTFELNAAMVDKNGGGIYSYDSLIYNAEDATWTAHVFKGTVADAATMEKNLNPLNNNVYTGNTIGGLNQDAVEGVHVYFERTSSIPSNKVVAHSKLNWVRIYGTEFEDGAIVRLFDAADNLTEVASKTYEKPLSAESRADEIYIQIDRNIDESAQYWVTIQNNEFKGAQSVKTVTNSINTPNISGLTAPVDEEKDVSLSPVLEWTSEASTTKYRVYLGAQKNSLALATETSLTQMATKNLDAGTVYYWRVESEDLYGATVTSKVASFTTLNSNVLRYDQNGDFQAAYDKLSEAVNGSADKDILKIKPGAVLDNETKQIELNRKELLICSADGTEFTVDMKGNDRVFSITDGASVTIRNVVITGGRIQNDYGAGVYVNLARLSLDNATITDNVTDRYGGGVYAFLGILNAVDTVVSSNTASWEGGGMYLNDSSIFAVDTVISSNTADLNGGGLYANISTVDMLHTTVELNRAVLGSGGGIYSNSGYFETNDNVWQFGGMSIEFNFSVSDEGVLLPDDTGTVKVKNNKAGIISSNQMYKY